MSTEIIERPEQQQQLGELQSSALARMTESQIDQAIAVMDKVAEARQRFIQVCLRRAEADDFIDFDGKPYLEGEGAQRVASTVGIQLEEPTRKAHWEGDDCFIEISGGAYWPLTGARSFEIGVCNTRDKFYAGRNGESATMGKMLEACNNDRKLASRMLEGHITKKALMNWTSRVVSAVMGIKGISWNRLESLGFGKEGAGAKVQFGKGKDAAKKGADLPFVPLYELPTIPKDSHVSTSAVVSRFATRTANTRSGAKEVLDVMLNGVEPETDSPIEFKASMWGSKPDWLGQGTEVDVLDLEVGAYQGKPQYTIKAWQQGAPNIPME